MTSVWRLDLTASLEMVRRDSLPLRMLLGSCRPWIEEVVDALESSTSLS